jgi:general secretion pathway protein A
MWQRHWGLASDPFAELKSPYVPLPSHEEALARLVHAIETAQRQVFFSAEAGLGKTTVVRRAISETRSPRRRMVLMRLPVDRSLLVTQVAERLGQPVGRDLSRTGSWRALERAVRVAALEGFQIVVALDGAEDPFLDDAQHELRALAHLGFPEDVQLTVIVVVRMLRDPQEVVTPSWNFAIGLERLTRSQAEDYLTAKLAAAGCPEHLFTPHAITRLHGLSRGVPRGLERLATLTLQAGALHGHEVITPDVVDRVAEEFWGVHPG